MKRYVIMLTAAALVFASCKEDESFIADTETTFDLTQNGSSVLRSSETGKVEFGFNLRFGIDVTNASRVTADVPAGWECIVTMDTDKDSVVIYAPSYDNMQADISGNVVFKVYDGKGGHDEYPIPVEVFERDMVVTITDDVSNKQMCVYQHVKFYGYSLSKFAEKPEITVPAGWTSSFNAVTETFAVTAPALDASDSAVSGTVSIRALSPRGTAGEAKTFQVEVSAQMPTMAFATDSYSMNYGQTVNVPYTHVNVTSIDVSASSIPDGWVVVADIPNSQIKVTAPARATSHAAAGEIRLSIASATANGTSDPLSIRLYGINSANEFRAFRTEYEKSEPDLTPWLAGDEVMITADFALTGADLVYVSGTESSDPKEKKMAFMPKFAGYGLNGNGYAITVNCANMNCKELGFFGSIGGSTTRTDVDNLTRIHDLTLKGSMTSIYAPTAEADGLCLGALATRNDGATVADFVSDVDISHLRSDISTLNNVTYVQGTYIGGITAYEGWGSPVYTNCRVSGDITVNGGARAVGGISAYIMNYDMGATAANGNYTYTNCVYSGIISYSNSSGFAATANTSTNVGGIVGQIFGAFAKITDCTNEGSINLYLPNYINACGGILGAGYAEITGCVNSANITAAESAGERRYGGIVGNGGGVATALAWRVLKVTNCTNEGNIKCASGMGATGTGGMIGYPGGGIHNNTVTVTGCVNRGTIELTAPVLHFGGLVGCMGGAQVNMSNCKNFGTLRGFGGACVAGLIGAGVTASPAGVTFTIDNCEVDCDMIIEAKPIHAGYLVQASGYINSQNMNAIRYNITNCKSVIRVTAANGSSANLKSNEIYGFYRNSASAVTADASTTANSSVVIVP